MGYGHGGEKGMRLGIRMERPCSYLDLHWRPQQRAGYRNIAGGEEEDTHKGRGNQDMVAGWKITRDGSKSKIRGRATVRRERGLMIADGAAMFNLFLGRIGQKLMIHDRCATGYQLRVQ